MNNLDKIKNDFMFIDLPMSDNKMFNEKIFKIPTKGCLNIHTGLVQGFRGTDSCYWAI